MNIYNKSIASDFETVLKSPELGQFQSLIREVYHNAKNEFPTLVKEEENGVKVIPLSLDQPIELADKLEYHKNFWDLHITIEGEDEYRFKRLKDCEDEFKPYDSENDYGLYSDDSDISLTVESGDAVLIDTNLAHMALCGRGHVKKLVIKIPK